ncbi:UDP-N-acetylglucosamine 1-carboxyvinyltransferase [beta proteobacterium KB13]|uniref:UDP-N-acetylglucosamine 1-carboxyvinyltransferase n=1 Tax=beta proteobacterium KB13 TaxID=314607 RepID=B6BVA9_9PROT|nr:UDP-N-acetylglucosamine 1-carboxyvinyltransferase [beta proteobacterium KB13]
MDKLKITGGFPLHGEVEISGAKNAALPILIASILSSDQVDISNVPKLKDIDTTIRLLEFLGVSIDHSDGNVSLIANNISKTEAPYDLVKTMRASILVLGPLLSRFGRAHVSLPGGCSIGARPVDLHIQALEKMGANISIHNGYIDASTEHLSNKKLIGTKIFMDQVSVTGTENIMMAATLADGKTFIENAAREPEVEDLGNLLISMGAKIKGLGTDVIEIEGVAALNGSQYKVMFDRIEAGTYMAAAVVSGGEVKLKNVDPRKMESVIEKIKQTGADVIETSTGITIKKQHQPIKPVNIRTGVYPLFPTDMQAQFMAINVLADGPSEITETIFENRFMHVQELVRMGASIDVKGNTSFVKGVQAIDGANVMATDLRASASLVIAGLAAKGETIIERIYHLDRGYERIEEKLNKLGAKVERLN